MIRKSLFWGLTLVLLLALAYLIIRGRLVENQQAGQPQGIVREYKPSATRVLAPKDLEFLKLEMTLMNEADPSDPAKESLAARHIVEIRNNGKAPYMGLRIRFEYLGRDGNVLETRTYRVERTILPQTILELPDIEIRQLPVNATDFRAYIAYADVGRTPRQPDSQEE